MKIEEVVGQQIAALREVRRMTQAELGDRVGQRLGRTWSRQAVSTAEKGGRSFTAVELLVLALELQVTVGSLFQPQTEDEEITLPTGQVIPTQALLSVSLDSLQWNELTNGETYRRVREKESQSREESERLQSNLVEQIDALFAKTFGSREAYAASVARMEKNHRNLEEATRAIIAEYREASTYAHSVEDRLIARLAERAALVDSPEAKAFGKLLREFQAAEDDDRAATEVPPDEDE